VSEPVVNKRRGLPLRVKMRHDPHFVEELAARHETSLGRFIPLSAIEPDPHQPRSAMGDLGDLVASIRDKGVLEPLLVRRQAEGATKSFRIISGERRYRASIEAGLFEVPAIEMDVTDQEALEIALIENLQRKDLTPFEEAEGYRALGDQHGYTHEQIAEVMGRSRTSVTEALSLLSMPPRVRDAVNALGLTSKSTLLEILRTGDEATMLGLLERAASEGLSRADLRREGKSARKTAGSSARKKPYVFKFRAPDKTYSLALSFRQSTVDREDLIRALENILTDLRNAKS
jgi:ParB family transcriptional regulator, chromosome partitioning protein